MEIDYIEFLGRIAPILSSLVAALSFAIGWIVSARKSRSEREKELQAKQNAISEGVLALIRSQIVDDYEKYVIRGIPLTVERRNELDRAHNAYVTLGGNGTIDHLYKEITRLPTHIAGSER